ncbi:MAG: arylsulfatase A-like enzyme [Rhodothermales bacterium]|jgi:arylsulfatase A-like enzyme
MIIYFNDNSTDDSGKGSCYEGGSHVPMMIHKPGLVVPGTRTELVANIDIAPTVFELCGISAPKDMHLDGASLLPLLRGEDVAWREALYLEIGLTRAVVSGDFKYLAFRIPESYLERSLEDRMAEHKATMAKINTRLPWTRKYWKIDPEAKFLQMGMAPGGDAMERMQLQDNPPFLANYFAPDQLYNLQRDPRETSNLADNPEYAIKLRTMQAQLSKLLADVPGTFADLKPE